ncbi:FAD-binding oxidoreductase [Deinococcus sp.]|uniref:FAD-binding oxidoreductase n=1 Tax=Deinococcus sp. TaxID=47478 RepID=UPI003CC554B2
MTTTPQANALHTDLLAMLGERGVLQDERSLTTFSKDAFYYSPVLRAELADKRADIIAAPQSVEELRELVRYACAHDLPLTMRGSGTGNYGQCVPLAGGIVVSTHRLGRILELNAQTGVARTEPGARLGQIERQARPLGWELRCYPSTWATAAVGGFVGGGFGGVGSVRNGVLWDGFLRSIIVMEVTPQAALHRLEGAALLGFIHAYGTSGIMVELEVNLSAAVPWEEAALSFPDLESALRFGHALALDAAQDKRLISLHEWPIPGYFGPLEAAGGVASGRALALLELREGRTDAVLERARAWGGELTYRTDSAAYHAGKFCLSDFTWNHTTLWAMRRDEGWTYLQSNLSSEVERALAQMAELRAYHGQVQVADGSQGCGVAFHLEIGRQGVGSEGERLFISALDLIYLQDAAQIQAAVDERERIGVSVANPHTYFLDADPRWSGQPVLDARAAYNPRGLLNPGKLSRGAEAGSA